MKRFLCCLASLLFVHPLFAETGVLKAGAFAADITPTNFPVIVNGGFLSRTADSVSDRLHARCIVLDNGHSRIALVVADSCMLPRELIDAAKVIIEANCDIPSDRVMISSTHTHTAPSAMGALGTPPDEAYVKWVPARIAEGVRQAAKRLAPAGVAFRSIHAPEYVACRRWIWRPGVIKEDPFGEMTVRANMHPGHQNPDAMGPSGPEDPALTTIGIFHADGRPMALLGNFGMHYFSGVKALSADYFSRYADYVKKGLGGDDDFVGILSNGTSGDMWRRDYTQPKAEKDIHIDDYARALAEKTVAAFYPWERGHPARPEAIQQKLALQTNIELKMEETILTLKRRTPDKKRQAWAKKVIEEMGDRLPKSKPEVYAKEAFYLLANPVRDIKLQAIRIGDIALATLPTETYALTGLRLKAISPFKNTMVISLANGGEGYIPPPEQYVLGGYNTWPARSAALEEQAEPKMVAELSELLGKVCDQPVKQAEDFFPRPLLPAHSIAQAWFSLHDFSGPVARNSIPTGRHGTYEDGVVFYLPGLGPIPRAPHFAGGRIRYELPRGNDYEVSLWFWNAMPHDARKVTGYLLSRGDKNTGEHLGIGAHNGHVDDLELDAAQGRLIFHSFSSRQAMMIGKTVIQNRSWHHLRLVRKGHSVQVFLDYQLEIDGSLNERWVEEVSDQLYIGGRSDNAFNFEGKIDEVVIW